ncbi:FkbM family methyltransferase [Alphaproteobacteria bacterium]|nr:FkbM family methyltransferase [Alphaproteobacteria bacterium]
MNFFKVIKFIIFNYIIVIFKAHNNFFRVLSLEIMFYMPNLIVCRFMNLLQIILNKRVKFFYDKEKILFFALESSKKHYFCSKMRGFSLYANGISKRSSILAKSYFIDKINFEKSDTVIDCGANYGDLFPYLKKYINPNNYHSFEPGQNEFKCLKVNAKKGINNQLGLNINSKETSFYVNSQDGDSSFLEPKKGYEKNIRIKTISFDEYIKIKKIKFVKLFKLEAEGFEPEILQGSKLSINIVEYVALDGGEERGVAEAETLSMATNFLLAHNFELLSIDIKSKMGRALFRNKSFINSNLLLK